MQEWRHEFEMEGIGVNTVKTVKFEKGTWEVHDPPAPMVVPPLPAW